MKLENRTELMNHLGAEQRNTVWSWCAVNEKKKKVYLSVWADTRKKREGDEKASYLIQEPWWGIKDTGSKSAARNDHDQKLSKIFDDGYEPYGYYVVAKDVNAVPREILKIKTSFVSSLKLKKLPDGTIICYPVGRVKIK
jgi:hypothetical protein